MNKAFILEGNTVTIIDIIDWSNYNKHYIKLLTSSGKIIMCSSNIVRFANNIDENNDKELVKKIYKKELNIKYYEESKKLILK